MKMRRISQRVGDGVWHDRPVSILQQFRHHGDRVKADVLFLNREMTLVPLVKDTAPGLKYLLCRIKRLGCHWRCEIRLAMAAVDQLEILLNKKVPR